MVDVNTIIGTPIETASNTTIIPVSKVCFGFAAGGSEFKGETTEEYSRKEEEEMIQYRLPFGGGSGAGVSINPVAFLSVSDQGVKLLPVKHSSAIDKLLDSMPELLDKVSESIEKACSASKGSEAEVKGVEKEVNTEKKDASGTRKKTTRKKATTTKRPNMTYEFDYTSRKPETHIDEEIAEYFEEEMEG